MPWRYKIHQKQTQNAGKAVGLDRQFCVWNLFECIVILRREVLRWLLYENGTVYSLQFLNLVRCGEKHVKTVFVRNLHFSTTKFLWACKLWWW